MMVKLVSASLLSSLLFISVLSADVLDLVTGNYVNKKEIILNYAYSKSLCLEEGGVFEGDDENGYCFVEIQDSLEIVKDDEDYKISLLTVGGNYHNCSFEEKAKLVGTQLISSVEVEEYNSTIDDFEKVQCEVSVTFSPDNQKAEVLDNGNCQSFCGMRAVLTGTFEKTK